MKKYTIYNPDKKTKRINQLEVELQQLRRVVILQGKIIINFGKFVHYFEDYFDYRSPNYKGQK